MFGRWVRRLVPVVATVLLVPIAGPVAAQPAESVDGDHTSFRFYDRNGYFFTPAGAVRMFTPPTKITGTRYTPYAVGVSVSLSYTEYWGVSFNAPDPLTVGTYTDAAPWGAVGSGSPEVDFSGPGRGCGEVGTFTISQLEYGADGALTKFSATFEQSCNQNGVPDLFGSVAYHADQPAAPVPHGPPDAPTGISAAGGTDALTLSWTNPPQSFADLVIRRVTGTPVATRDPNVGDLIYTGSGQSVQVNGLSPNTQYAFTFFARNAEGTYGPQAYLVTRGSKLSIAQAQLSTVPIGSKTVVEAFLQDQDNQLLGGQLVQFWGRKPGTTTWTPGAQAVTNEEGYVGFEVTPGTSMEYRFTFPGGQNLTGSRSGNVRVTVEPALSLKGPTAAKVGRAFALTVNMKPALSGEKVQLFEVATGNRGKRKVVGTAKLKRGVVTFKVTPRAKGTYVYYVEHPQTHSAAWNSSNSKKVKVR